MSLSIWLELLMNWKLLADELLRLKWIGFGGKQETARSQAESGQHEELVETISGESTTVTW